MLVPGAAALTASGTAPAMPDVDQPGPFSLANPDRVRSILDDAGYQNIDIVPVNDVLAITDDQIEHVAMMSTQIGPVGEALRHADDRTQKRVTTAVEDALRARLDNGRVELSRGTLHVAAGA